VAGKLRNLAKRIGSRLAGVVRRGVAAGRAVVGRVVKAGGAAAGAVARGAVTAGRYAVAGGKAVVRGARTAASKVVAAGKAVVVGAKTMGGAARRTAGKAIRAVRTAAVRTSNRFRRWIGKYGVASELEEEQAASKLSSAAESATSDVGAPSVEQEVTGVGAAKRAAAASTPQQALKELMGEGRYKDYEAYIESLKLAHPELKGIPTEELIALRGYTTSDYQMLNKALRSRDPEELVRLKPYIDKATAALEDMPAHKGTVFRGVRELTPEQLGRYKPGEVITEPAFTSASTAAEQAFAGKVLVVIESETGKSVELVSRYAYEKEVLFPPGTRFRVLAVDKVENDVTRIFLKEVNT
jgi:hypothetical protein